MDSRSQTSEVAPDLIGAVVGVRTFKLRGRHLCSVGTYEPWKAGVNHAACRTSAKHKAPASNCQCGLYAWHEAPLAQVTPTGGFHGSYGGDLLAIVRAWGDLEVHATGFRAEYAEVIGLVGVGEVNRALSKRYGVPMVPVDEVEDFVMAAGGPVPAELRPKYAAATKLLGDHVAALHKLGKELGESMAALAKSLEQMGYKITPGKPSEQSDHYSGAHGLGFQPLPPPSKPPSLKDAHDPRANMKAAAEYVRNQRRTGVSTWKPPQGGHRGRHGQDRGSR